jgi:hypothetical protein
MPMIKGELYWASIHQPNTTFEPKWSVDVFVDEDTGKALQAEGLNPKHVKANKAGDGVSHPGKTIGDVFFNFKRKTAYPDGAPQSPPRVVDAKRNPVPASTLVGNGSVANISYKTYEYNFKGTTGISSDLAGVQVLSLVEYEDKSAPDFEDAEGYTGDTDGDPFDE